jgi:hypothetical protein
VPIDAAQIAALLVGAIFGIFAMIFGEESLTRFSLYLFFASGLAVFLAAMKLDMSDRLRVTRRSDTAFWLHLLAAPLLIHPIAEMSFADISNLSTPQAVVILVAFGGLALFALIIDRRAILVSALAYTGTALGYLIEKTTTPDLILPVTLLLLALVVLSLSAGWHDLRARVVNRLPWGGLREIIPPVL